MPRRIVINTSFGGFSLSSAAQALFKELSKETENPPECFSEWDGRRDDPILLQVVETLGPKAASGNLSSLGFTEIPDDVPEDGWTIQEYDGAEWVAEKHRTWHHMPELSPTT